MSSDLTSSDPEDVFPAVMHHEAHVYATAMLYLAFDKEKTDT